MSEDLELILRAKNDTDTAFKAFSANQKALNDEIQKGMAIAKQAAAEQVSNQLSAARAQKEAQFAADALAKGIANLGGMSGVASGKMDRLQQDVVKLAKAGATLAPALSGLTAKMNFEKVRKDIEGVGQASSLLGRGLLAMTVPIVGAGGASLKFAADFDKAMNESVAIMPKLDAAMRQTMEKTAREVALTTTNSAQDAAKSFYYLASAGFTAEQSIGALPKVAAFAQAGVLSMESATSLLNSSIKSLGLDVTKDMTHVSDVIVKAAVASDASVQQLAESLANKAGAAMARFNISIEEGAAVLSVFADMGIRGATAGERLDILLRTTTEAAFKHSSAFKELGINVFDAHNKLRNMADIVQDVEKAFAGMSDKEKVAALNMLGIRSQSQSALMALVGHSGKIREYEEALKNAGGTTQAIADQQMKSFSAQMDIVKKSLEDASITLGQALMPTMRDFSENILKPGIATLAEAVQWFSGLPEPVRTGSVALVGMGAAAGTTLVTLGYLAKSVSGLMELQFVQTMGSWAMGAAGAESALGLLKAGGIAALEVFGAFAAGYLVGTAIMDLISQCEGGRKAIDDMDEAWVRFLSHGKGSKELAAGVGTTKGIGENKDLVFMNDWSSAQQVAFAESVKAKKAADELAASQKGLAGKTDEATTAAQRQAKEQADVAAKTLKTKEQMDAAAKAAKDYAKDVDDAFKKFSGADAQRSMDVLAAGIAKLGGVGSVGKEKMQGLRDEVIKLAREGATVPKVFEGISVAVLKAKNSFAYTLSQQTPLLETLGLTGPATMAGTDINANMAAGNMGTWNKGVANRTNSWDVGGAQIAKAQRATMDWSKALGDVTHAFELMGISAESTLAKVIGGFMGAMAAGQQIQAMSKANAAMAGGSAGWGGMSGSQKLGVAMQGVGVMAGAYSAGRQGGYVKGGLSGAASGAAFGAAVGSVVPGLGTVVGGVIGGVVGLASGLFGGSQKKKQDAADLKAAQAEWLKSQGGMEQLRKTANMLGVDISKAFSTKSPEEFKRAQDALTKGMEDQKKRIEGIHTAMAGLELRTKGFTREMEASGMSAGEVAQRLDKYQAKLKEAGLSESELAKRVHERKRALEQASEVTDRQQASFDRLGRFATAAFALQIKESGDVITALGAIEPTLGNLAELQAQFGFTSGETFAKLMQLRDVVQVNGDVADSISAINQMMTGFSDAGGLTAQMLTDLGADAAEQFGILKDRGVDANQALGLMQPTIQQLWEHQQKFHDITDEATLALIRQGEEQGLVGENMRSVNEQMLDVLLAIADVFGAKIPEGMRAAADESKRTSEQIRNDWNGLGEGGGGGPDRSGVHVNEGFADSGSIPYTPGGRLVRAGERGREHILSDGKIEDVVGRAVAQAMSAAGGGVGGGGDIHVHNHIDGREVSRSVYRWNRAGYDKVMGG